jgi:RNA polymerase sigma factor CnrH
VDPDLPLIQALQAGDDSALGELMSRHREPLFHFVYRLVRDETAARDVVQETFVRVYFGTAKFRPKALVKTWVYAIAVNLGRDHVRRLSKRRSEVSLAEAAESGQNVVDQTPLASDAVRQRDEFALLQRGIDELPQPLREALVIFSLEGKSQREAAEILGTTPKTVELRVYHAKRKLREWFDAVSNEPPDFLRDQPASGRLSK